MKKLLLLSITMLLIFCGCNLFLPDGDPPPGNIIDNPSETKKYNVTEAVDYLITMFTVAVMEKCPGENIGIVPNNDRDANTWANVVLQQSSKITGSRQTASASDWMLDSRISGTKVTMTLLHRNTPVWSDSVTVTR